MDGKLWLPLLRELTASCPSWLVWKNAEQALEGRGDVDGAARAADLPRIVQAFARWARDRGAPRTFLCRHIPGKTLLFCSGSDRALAELDVMEWIAFRGGLVTRATDLAPLAVLDPLGFRRLRPGAEAALLLMFNGIRPGGRPNAAALLQKRLPARLSGDMEGVALATRTVGGSLLARLASAVAVGSWDRRAALLLEASGVVRSVARPLRLARRLYVRMRRGRVCPLAAAVREGRHIKGDVADWLRRAERDHEVLSGFETTPVGP